MGAPPIFQIYHFVNYRFCLIQALSIGIGIFKVKDSQETNQIYSKTKDTYCQFHQHFVNKFAKK